jgi:PilZ domain
MEWEIPKSSRVDVPYKRYDTRFALKPPLGLSIHGDPPPATCAQLINVSRSGAAILADVLLGDPGALLVLDLPDHSTGERAPAPCELRWVLAEKDALPRRWLHGALFGNIDLRARQLIEHLVHDARRRDAIQ